MKETRYTSNAVTPVDERFLEEVYFHRYLTSIQMNRLLYKPGNFTTTKDRLKKLRDLGYLQVVREESTRQGLAFVYTLDGNGMQFLTKRGYEPYKYFRPSEQADKENVYLDHTLSVNDFFIAAQVMTAHDPRVSLVEKIHELTFASYPCVIPHIKAGRGKPAEIEPDGWLDFFVERGEGLGRRRFSLWLELDRNTIFSREKLKKKIRLMLAFCTYRKEKTDLTEYETRFKSKNVRFLFATIGDTYRLATVRSCIREVLAETNEKRWVSTLFYTTILPLAVTHPKELQPIETWIQTCRSLFFDPVWYWPFDDDAPVPVFNLT